MGVVPQVRPGSITPELVHDVASASEDVIAPAVTLDVLWALAPYHAVVCPGSHKFGRHPTVAESANGGAAVGNAQRICVPSGSCLIMDGRLWQASAQQATTLCLQYNFCGPQFRAEENHQLTIRPEVLAALPELARAVLGFRSWNSYGSEFGSGNEQLYTPAQRAAVEALLPDASMPGPSLAEQLLEVSMEQGVEAP